MKHRITHKEITLIFGVIIALLIAITLWFKRPVLESSSKSISLPKILSPAKAKSLVETAVALIKAI